MIVVNRKRGSKYREWVTYNLQKRMLQRRALKIVLRKILEDIE